MRKNPVEILRRLYRERFKNRSKYSIRKENELKETTEMLSRDGIIVLENYFDSEFCETAIAAMDQYFHDHQNILEDVKAKVATNKEFKFGVPLADGTSFWVDSLESDLRIIHAEKISSLIQEKFYSNDYFVRVGENMLHHQLQRNFTMANRTSFRASNLGSGGGWHRDNNYQHGFKALVYLTDVTQENGPFEYIKRSFTLRNHLFDFPFPDKYQFSDAEIQNYIAKNEKLHFITTAKAGALVMFNTNGIHRGMPLQHGVRYALTNYYKPV